MLEQLGDRTALSIDWDAWRLRIVQVRGSRTGPSVLRVLTAPMPDELATLDQAEPIGHFIRRVLDQEGIRTRRAMVDVPRHQVILNSIQLPDAPVDELVSMVRFQVAKDLPFAQDQAVLDFVKMAHTNGEASVDVLVAAIRDDMLAFYKQVFTSAGLKLIRVGLRPYATSVGVVRANVATAAGRSLVLDIGPKMTEIDLLRDGHLVFSRSAEVPVERAQDMVSDVGGADDEAASPVSLAPRKSVEDLLVQVTRTVAGFRATDPGAELDRIVVAGNTGIESEFAAAVQQRMRVPASIYDPSPMLAKSVRSGHGDLREFAAALGLAVSDEQDAEAYFDFLHPKKEVTIQQKRLRKVPLVATTVVLAAVAMVVGYTRIVTPKHQRIAALQREIDALERQKKLVDELDERFEDLKEWQDDGVVWTDELARLVEVFPDTKDVYTSEIRGTSKNEMRIETNARESDGSNKLLNSLAEVKVDGEEHFVVRPSKTMRTNDKYAFKSEVVATPVDQVEKETPKRRRR